MPLNDQRRDTHYMRWCKQQRMSFTNHDFSSRKFPLKNRKLWKHVRCQVSNGCIWNGKEAIPWRFSIKALYRRKRKCTTFRTGNFSKKLTWYADSKVVPSFRLSTHYILKPTFYEKHKFVRKFQYVTDLVVSDFQ